MEPQPPAKLQRLSRYLPRPVIAWLHDAPDQRCRSVDGTLVFADVSGFTALSERLARQGRVGAEMLAETISASFTRLLAAAYANGGSLLKFGGDALLLLFTGDDHCARAAHASVGMRRELRGFGVVGGAGGRARLRMSVGLHTGVVHLFLIGDSYREFVVTGPAATQVVRMESAADKGEILLSPEAAAVLPAGCVGEPKADGFLLRRAPSAPLWSEADHGFQLSDSALALGVPPWLRERASGADDPQHRLVTVAFLKFQGADRMLTNGGDSALADALHALVSTAQAATEQNDVFLLGSDVDKDGGKLLIVGGAPQASGHDEEATLCAARQIIDASSPLSVRLGVHTGPAFAGDVGPAYRRTFTVMGDTVNLAARVMAHAEPGTLLATKTCVDRCRVPFGLTPVPPFFVKGKTAPVTAVDVGPVTEDAVQRQDDTGLLVGRDTELAHFEDAWVQAATGRTRTLVLVGEPGIGKSRLLAEAKSRLSADLLAVTCEQYAANTPYAAVRQLLRQALGCARSDDECVQRRLHEVLSTATDDIRRFAPLLGLVLRIDLPMTREVEELDERFRRERLELTVVDVIRHLVTAPTFITVEDAHWMDEASAQLMQRLVAEVSAAPWLVCVTRRPVARGWQPATPSVAAVLELKPLSATAATALAEVLAAGGRELAPQLIDELVCRSGGNPLFLAELMASLTSTDTAELPDSLEGLLLARIDALRPGDGALLRRLSVLGSSFDFPLARRVLGDALPDISDAVWTRLAEFVEISRGHCFSFKHALLMDGAYNSLPFRVRESLHGAVAAAIEQQAGASASEHAEALSLHYFHAKRHDKAWSYSRLAAGRAQRVFANVEAARFLTRALEAARRGRCASDEDRLAALEELGDVCGRMGELQSAAEAYQAARRLARVVADQSRLLLKQARVRQLEGSFAQARQWLARAERVLQSTDDSTLGERRAQLAVARASVAKDQDRPREIEKWCRLALIEAERAGDLKTEAHAAFLLDHALVRLGRNELATHSERALALFEQLGDLWGQGSVLNNIGIRAYWAGRWDEAVDLYNRGRTVMERIGDIGHVAGGLANVGEIRSDQGRLDEAAELFERARRIYERVGDRASVAFVLSNLGRLATRSEMFDQAYELLNRARDLAEALALPADVLDADLRIVECLCHRGAVDEAVELAERVAPGVPAHSLQAAMLERLVGYALLQRGELGDARARFEVSLLEARAAEVPHEEGLTLRALAYLDSAVGVDPMPHLVQAEEILTRLGVVAIDEPVNVSLATTTPVAIPEQSSAGSTDSVAS